MGLAHTMHEEWELSQTLYMPSKFIPVAPLEDSQSLFDLYAVLPAGRPGDASSPFSLPFQVTHSFLKDPEVSTLSCSGISYVKIGQTHQDIGICMHPLLVFIIL